MTIIEILKFVLDIVIQLSLIFGVLALIYVMFWVAAFFPIVKLRKHKQKVAEFEKEFNKIEVETTAALRMQETTDDKLRQTLYILSQKELELEKINKQIESKTDKKEKK